MSVTPPVLERPTFDAIRVGDELGPVRLRVDDHFRRRYGFTVEDATARDAPDGSAVTALAVVNDLLRLFNTRFDPDDDFGIHQKEEIWLHAPVPVGEELVLTGRFTEKYVRRGKGYYVAEAEARSAGDGALHVRHRITEIAELPPGTPMGTGDGGATAARTVRGEAAPGRPLARRIADARPGDPVAGPRVEMRQDQMSIFSNVHAFWRSVHTDLEMAQRAGHERTLAQGLMGASWIGQMARDLFGETWEHSGHLDLRFLVPVHAGDVLSTHGVVLERTGGDGSERAELEVWIENQRGERVTVGWVDGDVR